MHEHFCELTPGDDPSQIDGHLLVVVDDGSSTSRAYVEMCERRVTRLNDKSEFQLAIVGIDVFPELSERAPEFPALFHFACGVENSRAYGIDDCVEFLREFIISNYRK